MSRPFFLFLTSLLFFSCIVFELWFYANQANYPHVEQEFGVASISFLDLADATRHIIKQSFGFLLVIGVLTVFVLFDGSFDERVTEDEAMP